MAKPPSNVATVAPALVALVIGAAGAGYGYLSSSAEALPGALLMAFVLWIGLSLGGLSLLLINHMAGGSWGAVSRRPLEAMVATLPVGVLFFLPVAYFVGDLYLWADPVYVAAHKLVAWKANYLNETAYLLRSAGYFAVWLLTAVIYLRMARRQDNVDAGRAGILGYRMKASAALWLVLFVLSMTLAATDWTMSLQPEWWSGIYGIVFMISQAIMAMSLLILTMVWLAKRSERVDGLLTEKRLQDLGNFLMAFTMFWAYVNASQLIIQWTNNIVETNTFYVLRLYEQPWQGLGVYLLAAGFALPFFTLFSRWVKRQRLALAFMAGWAIINQMLHLYWYVAPEVGRTTPPALADIAVVLGLGAVWLGVYLFNLGRHSVIPELDPRLLAAEHHHAHPAAAKPEVRHA
jgi:hypothetical protein